ncbi:MAG: hypothetical protein EBQ51_08490 [Verrucomicrobia bacterium]|nr:hypothetical protein [Pseudomonadota bacterium]NBS06458.1 hypothetical protein [Verrucomicrobiota bacterium]NBS78361.1 hypothetical protein [bacterium]NBT24127.1 hypothetical protein [bacterium]NBY67090.1 hypothetical protein [Verrucomicrobiota bacterium]
MAGTLRKTGWLSWTLTVGSALVLGFGLGRLSAPEPQINKESEPAGVALNEKVLQKSGEVEDRGGSEPAPAVKQDTTTDVLAKAMALTDPKSRNRELENCLSRASLEDVKRALEWASTLPDGAGKRAAMARIMERWGQLDGANAVAYGEKLFAETGNPDLLKDAMRGWGQTNPMASLQYAQSMGVSDGLRRDILRDLVRDWADRSPQAAAAYAASNRLDLGRGGTTALIADRWSKQDPQTAANWAMSLPQGKEQIRALDELVQNWCDLNLQAAADFVSRQQPGVNKDAMVGTLAREVAKQDPASALKWVATIQDGGVQENTAWSIYQRALRRDPEGAQQMLQSSPLPIPTKQSLLAKAAARDNAGTDSRQGVP